MAALASVLPCYLFLIRPPAHAAIGQWAIAEYGKLTIFGACTGAIITIGFAAYGAGVAQLCRWAFARFVIGFPAIPDVARSEQLCDRCKFWPVQPTGLPPSEHGPVVQR